jgi:hypothetical protein
MKRLLLVCIVLFATVQTSSEAEVRFRDRDIEFMLTQIVMCESSGNPEAIGDRGKARGICQFHEKTFYAFAKLAGLEHPKWLNTDDQLYLLRWALSTDVKYARAWTCFRSLYVY